MVQAPTLSTLGLSPEIFIMCGSVSWCSTFDNRDVILSLVLTPYLPRIKVRKQKKLLSGSEEPVEEPEEVCS
jgi:hypothetical protein